MGGVYKGFRIFGLTAAFFRSFSISLNSHLKCCSMVFLISKIAQRTPKTVTGVVQMTHSLTTMLIAILLMMNRLVVGG